MLISYLGIGIKEANAGIGIPASIIPVWYRTKKMPDCLTWFGTRPDPASLVFSEGMPDSSAFRHLYTQTRTRTCTHTYDVRREHGRAVWT
jgi:hypothetical protein